MLWSGLQRHWSCHSNKMTPLFISSLDHLYLGITWAKISAWCKPNAKLFHGRISSVGRALDCRAGGCRLNFRGRTNTQGLKITKKWRYSSPLQCKRVDFCVARMTMLNGGPVSSWRHKKIVSAISTFRLNTVTLK